MWSNLWFEVKALLEHYLANEALNVTQAQAAEAHRLIPVVEFVGPARTDVLHRNPERDETHDNCLN
jgi:hypothetical protein